ncbi:Ig-like domain-containing protein [Escherichia coli]|nr:Ig-like domain-containing protein [Escherichia coli]
MTVTLNGQNYTTTADASGNWSVTVPASRVSALGEATYTVTAAATDADGNSGSASHNVQVNTALPGVTINVVASDDIINAAEAGAGQTISGQVTGAAAGDTGNRHARRGDLHCHGAGEFKLERRCSGLRASRRWATVN